MAYACPNCNTKLSSTPGLVDDQGTIIVEVINKIMKKLGFKPISKIADNKDWTFTWLEESTLTMSMRTPSDVDLINIHLRKEKGAWKILEPEVSESLANTLSRLQ